MSKKLLSEKNFSIALSKLVVIDFIRRFFMEIISLKRIGMKYK